MSNYRNKVVLGKSTLFFYECPNCGAQRHLDKDGIKAILLMGSGGIAALIGVIALLGVLGLPGWIVLAVGGKKLAESELGQNISEKLDNLANKLPFFRRLEEKGISMFRCPKCGSGDMLID